ncbi:MAG: NUDIX hydrolase [Elusimicrobia bacterium]|jgi:8-oxo-dGTP diphosphatase|nr:NUDIX hydrolase [Elusimicrobiota bacterium]
MRAYKFCPHCKAALKRKKEDGIDRLVCSGCGWINYLNPVPAVACIVKDKDRILLVKRGVEPEKGKWSLPAGFMELGESPEEAVLRELKEEAGIDGKIKELIGVYAQPSKNYSTVLTVGYSVLTSGRDDDVVAGDDVTDAEFKEIEKAEDIPFVSHRRMLRDADALV